MPSTTSTKDFQVDIKLKQGFRFDDYGHHYIKLINPDGEEVGIYRTSLLMGKAVWYDRRLVRHEVKNMTVEQSARACAEAAGALADPNPQVPVHRIPEVGECFKVYESDSLLFIRTSEGYVVTGSRFDGTKYSPYDISDTSYYICDSFGNVLTEPAFSDEVCWASVAADVIERNEPSVDEQLKALGVDGWSFDGGLWHRRFTEISTFVAATVHTLDGVWRVRADGSVFNVAAEGKSCSVEAAKEAADTALLEALR